LADPAEQQPDDGFGLVRHRAREQDGQGLDLGRARAGGAHGIERRDDR
jgi:hypothetical protein